VEFSSEEKCLLIKFANQASVALLLVIFFVCSSVAQQTPPPLSPDASSAQTSSKDDQNAPQPDAPKQDAATDAPKATPKTDSTTQEQSGSGNPGSGNTRTQGKVAGTSNDRLFYTLPNFLTLQNAGTLPPLSVKDKFKVVALGTFDPVQYPWWALLSAIAQADDSEPQFRQGWLGYAKRYGTTAGDSTTENFMVGAVFPSILRQDPRFYQSGKGSIGRRTWYAATRILVTRRDSGRGQFNFSEVFGSAFAAAVSDYTYHPKSTYISTPANPHLFVGSDRTLSNTADVWATQVGLDTITFVVKEFWPDVHRKLSKKHATSPNP
jgi:hypothetical protein